MFRLFLALSIAFAATSATASSMHHPVAVQTNPQHQKSPRDCRQLPPMAVPTKCPDLPLMAMDHSGRAAPSQDKTDGHPGDPLCVGCVAPSTISPPALTARLTLVALPARELELRELLGDAAPPATPPPRHG